MIWKARGGRRVELEGRGPLNLDAVDHVATGGQGSVFRKGDIAIKIYADPNGPMQDGLSERIRLLSRISHPYIVAPKGMVVGPRNVPLGYWMAFAQGEPLSRLFTTEYRTRSGITDAAIVQLVDRMRAAVMAAHAHGATLVDGNELNYLAWLAGPDGIEPRLIDVDAWAIGRFRAQVIMPSIRDWHATEFNAGTDWFAWAIVTFQLFTGIHPYKGTAPGFARGDLEGRMRAGISVFHAGVRVNRATRDPTVIPATLRAWYEAVFEHGERSQPPSASATAASAPRIATVLASTPTGHGGALTLEKLLERDGDPAVELYPCGVVRLRTGTLVELASGRDIAGAAPTATSATRHVVSRAEGWLIADASGLQLVGRNGTSAELGKPTSGGVVVRAGERLLTMGDALTEILVRSPGGKPRLANGASWGILPHATRWFQGLGVQDTFGASWLIVPFGEASCAQIRVPELDGKVPISGLAGARFAVIVVQEASGDYRCLELAFDAEYRAYRLSVSDIDTADINTAILPRGVCATVTGDGELRVFVPASGDGRIVRDPVITTAMQLGAWNEAVLCIDNGGVYRLRMS